jgi:phosphomannomutase
MNHVNAININRSYEEYREQKEGISHVPHPPRNYYDYLGVAATEDFKQTLEQASELRKKAFSDLSYALARVADIDHDNNYLVSAIGDGDERTNIDALRHWVEREYLEIIFDTDPEASRNMVDVLYCSLNKKLESIFGCQR